MLWGGGRTYLLELGRPVGGGAEACPLRPRRSSGLHAEAAALSEAPGPTARRGLSAGGSRVRQAEEKRRGPPGAGLGGGGRGLTPAGVRLCRSAGLGLRPPGLVPPRRRGPAFGPPNP